MRVFLSFICLFLAREALADLYRWVDPDTGSVKFSSYPPPWYGDAEQEKRAPKVEHIPERSRTATGADPAAPASALDALEERRKRVMEQIAALPVQAQGDAQRAGVGLKQHLDAYAAVVTEMDRLDPKGAERRRAEGQPLLERLLEGLRAQMKPTAPVPAK